MLKRGQKKVGKKRILVTRSSAGGAIIAPTGGASPRGGKRVTGRYWRLVIPALDGYGVFPPRAHEGLLRLKQQVVDLLCHNQSSRGLDGWCVVWQTHAGSGLPHLDILLTYGKRVTNSPSRYDYLVKHGSLTKYRSLNRAILVYGLKQDSNPITNIAVQHRLNELNVRHNLYSMMQEAMLLDPFGFRARRWLTQKGLWAAAVRTNLFKTLRALTCRQQEECRARLVKKAGIRQITRDLVESALSVSELAQFDSWRGYATIVNHINQIPKWGYNRPHKSACQDPLSCRNLLVCGRPGIGKTALSMQIERYCPVYPLGTKGGWFPSFISGVYTMMVWDEFDLGVLPYGNLLKLLEGRPMQLPVKGGHAKRADNQLVYMTSNWSLQQHISHKFSTGIDRQHARLSLLQRVTEVRVPQHLDLFILLKLVRVAGGC